MLTGKCCNCGHGIEMHEFRMGPGPRGPVQSEKALRKFQEKVVEALKQSETQNDADCQDQE